VFFFFSSRRRHTRSKRDWSSTCALPIYNGEFEHAPDPRLWQDERVLITPHVSGGTDVAQHRAVEVFSDNLRAYLDGRPLANVIEIGRASCREREEIAGGAGAWR